MRTQRPGIVIPLYNEAARLDIDQIRQNTDLIHHWVFVDDGSTDQTNKLLASLVDEMNQSGIRAQLVTLAQNSGKGEAVRQGMLKISESDCELCGYLDADFSAPVAEFVRLATILKAGDTRILMGARVALLGRQVERSQTRHYIGRLAATLISTTLKLPAYDTQAGIKLFNRCDVNSLMDKPFISRWLFDCEILMRAKNLGFEIAEEPLMEWRNKKHSKVNATSYLRSLVDLVKIYAHARN